MLVDLSRLKLALGAPAAAGGGVIPVDTLTAENFRDYYPWFIENNTTPTVVTADTPTWTTLCTLEVLDNLPAGEYQLTPVFTWSMPDINDSAIFRTIRTDGGPPLELQEEPKDAGNLIGRSIPAALVPNWAGGPITVELQASKTLGAQNLTVFFAQLMLECKKRN